MVDEVVDLIDKLSLEIDNYDKALNKLKEDVNDVQNNSGKPYWNGELAYGWIQSALAHIDHDTVLGDNLKECLKYLKENNM